MLRLLADTRLFTFCFVVDPARVLTRNVRTIRDMLDRSIGRLERRPDRALRDSEINTLTRLRRKANSQRFNVRLFDNIVLAAAFAAFLTYLLCSYRSVTRVGWFSDRDSISNAYERFAQYLYASNVVTLSQRHLQGSPGPMLGVNGVVPPGGRPWCDAFVRAPDYFAGTVSAWHFDMNLIADTEKHREVVVDAIAGNPNVEVIRLQTKLEYELITAFAQSINIHML